jgi:hypothetical protein
MPVLTQRWTEIRAHWHATAHALKGVLPADGGDYHPEYEHGAARATLICGKYPNEIAERMGGTVVRVVPFLAATSEDELRYWLGWYEEWQLPAQGKATRSLQFRSSAITIYYGGAGTTKRQLLRAEWAGAESYSEAKNRHVFQADGAAHPHWHLDGIRTYYDDIARQIEATLTGFDRDQPELAGLVPLSTFNTPTREELAWTGIHLAAAVRWAEAPWPGPPGPHETHATSPTDTKQIRSWLTSCVRYLQVQFQHEIERGRS